MSKSANDRLGRPKKSPLEVRRNKSVRFNLQEEAVITSKAKTAGLDFGDFVRRSALGIEITGRSSRGADPALLTEIDRLGREVRALGNLTNQIALAVHTDRRLPREWQLTHMAIDRLRDEIADVLDRIAIGPAGFANDNGETAVNPGEPSA